MWMLVGTHPFQIRQALRQVTCMWMMLHVDATGTHAHVRAPVRRVVHAWQAVLSARLCGPRDGGPRDGGPRDGGPRDGGPATGERSTLIGNLCLWQEVVWQEVVWPRSGMAKKRYGQEVVWPRSGMAKKRYGKKWWIGGAPLRARERSRRRRDRISAPPRSHLGATEVASRRK